jgi:hypothetical protein
MPSYLGDPSVTGKRARYDKLRSALWSDRATFDSHYQELASWLLPRRIRTWSGDRNKGDKRNQNIIDSTARFSARTLSSGLHAGLTSPARPWMKLSTPDPDLAEFGPVKEWLHIVTQRMLTVFLQTNLYNVLPMLYGDLGVFGTACMSVVDDSKDLFRCYAYPIMSYALGQDARGLTTTFCREYELTVRQIVEQFGVKANGRDIDWTPISPSVHALWDSGDYETGVQVCWIVKPNEYARKDRLEAKYLPWTSCYFETGSRAGNNSYDSSGLGFLKESGFETFPIMAPRWDITGEDTYGTDCPGMTALGDIKQLQIMQRRKGQAISKMVDPPLVGPTELRTQKTSLLPGDITYVNQREGQGGLRAIHEVTLNIQHLREDIGEVQYRIQRAFYEDLFLMLARSDDQRGSQPITAREIDERHEEKLLALGPVLERTNDELLDPIVDRVFGLMEKAGLIPEPPTELHGVKLKVEYISIMAQAQKLVGVVGQDRFLQSAGMLMGMDPSVVAKINFDQVVDNYGEMLGVDPRIIRSTDDANAMRQQQAQAQQQAMDAENALKMAQTAKTASETPLTGDTALNRLVQGAAAQAGAA